MPIALISVSDRQCPITSMLQLDFTGAHCDHMSAGPMAVREVKTMNTQKYTLPLLMQSRLLKLVQTLHG